jgi:DNA repair protein RadC
MPSSPDTATAPHWGTRGPATGHVATSPGCPACAVGRPRRVAAPDAVAVTSPDRAAEVVMPMLGDLDREACVALVLDTRHRVLGADLVSLGSLDHTFMSPREVYRLSLLANAAAVVVAHNHPSGDVTPSSDDVRVTTRLARAGEIVGVDLLDHLVVATGRWTSLARLGRL